MKTRWTIQAVKPSRMLTDKQGAPLMRGDCFAVILTSDAGTIEVTVGVTGWAEHDAEEVVGSGKIVDVVREFVAEELSAGWDPKRSPYLTLDSHRTDDVLQRSSR